MLCKSRCGHVRNPSMLQLRPACVDECTFAQDLWNFEAGAHLICNLGPPICRKPHSEPGQVDRRDGGVAHAQDRVHEDDVLHTARHHARRVARGHQWHDTIPRIIAPQRRPKPCRHCLCEAIATNPMPAIVNPKGQRLRFKDNPNS